MKNTFNISISGSLEDATKKVKALAVLGNELTARELEALADFIKNGSSMKIAIAKKSLGL